MRSALMLLPLLVFACAKSEKPQSATASVTPAGSATLTEADVAGTWKGTAKAAGTDSVISHWTQICSAGTCRGTSQEDPKDTIPSTYTIAGDSAVGQSQPFAPPGMPGQIVDHWTVRIANGKVTGAGRYTLASKADSVVARYTIDGARQP